MNEEKSTPRDTGALRHHGLIVLILVLVGAASFGLGRLSSIEKANVPATIDYFGGTLAPGSGQTAAVAESSIRTAAEKQTSTDEVVASKKGSKYHYSYCPSASSISEENKIHFASAAAAEGAGYTLAANCKPK